MYTVHLHDRETDARGTYEVGWDWQRFRQDINAFVDDEHWWSRGSNSCDCTRLTYLYGRGEYLCNFGANRVVVEKIVANGVIVYQDSVEAIEHPLPAWAIA